MKDKGIYIRVNSEEHGWWKNAASDRGMTVSRWIRQVLNDEAKHTGTVSSGVNAVVAIDREKERVARKHPNLARQLWKPRDRCEHGRYPATEFCKYCS